jgi:hypothetical protein
VSPTGDEPESYAAGVAGALFLESAWSRLATISTVRRVQPSVACH